jgi:benzoate/toluate 1,2-dioxygenase beta subunit
LASDLKSLRRAPAHANGSSHLSPLSPEVDRQSVEDFLYFEARLADEHRYEEWEALWTDDAIYWVPIGGDDSDPEREVSLIYDNRNRLRTRIALLLTGERYAQVPQSGLVRVISNIEIQGQEPDGDVIVRANFVLVESRREIITWAGRNTYRLRPTEGGFALAAKKIVLAHSSEPVHKIAFIL